MQVQEHKVGRLSAFSSFRLYPACYDPTGQTSHKLDPESEWAQEEFAAVHDCLKNQFNIKNNQGLFTNTVCHVYWAIHRSAKNTMKGKDRMPSVMSGNKIFSGS